MKINTHILILIVSLSIMANVNAQQTGAWASLDSNAIMIGDQVIYELGITVPENSLVAWPSITDTLTSNIEILNRSNIDTTYTNSDITIHQQFLITSFDSGYFEIPPIDFKFGFKDDSTIYSTSTGVLFLQVFVPEVDTSQAFKPLIGPIKEPYTLAEVLPWIIVSTAGIIIIVLLIFYFIRRKKKQPIFKRKPKPIIPPHILAINQLEELRLAKVWQSGKLKRYYTELTDITREYLQNRYNFDAPEMTSYEIITELQNHSINKDAMGKIENVLNLSDLVKFAKAVPTALENDLGLTHCVDFVNETKKVVAEPSIEKTEESKLKESE